MPYRLEVEEWVLIFPGGSSAGGPSPPPNSALALQNPGGLRGEAGDRPSDTRGGRAPPVAGLYRTRFVTAA